VEYKILRGSNSVFQLWTEWTLGLMFYSRRRKVIKEIRRRVEAGAAKDERQAIDQLEQLRGTRSLDWLCKNIPAS